MHASVSCARESGRLRLPLPCGILTRAAEPGSLDRVDYTSIDSR